jgi:hypothetical protein
MSNFKRYLIAIKAYLLFILIDVGFSVYGFGKVYRFFIKTREKDTQRAPQPEDNAVISDICKAVKTATAFYYRPRKDCLPKALTIYYLLRRQGVPVNFCLGVKKYPFSAHSWVEYQGETIDDREAKAYVLLNSVSTNLETTGRSNLV